MKGLIPFGTFTASREGKHEFSRFQPLNTMASSALDPSRRSKDQALDDGNTALERFADVLQHLEKNEVAAAASLLEQFPFHSLRHEDALTARALALQVAVDCAQYDDALLHADAALELTGDDPLIYHLTGRALWATGYHQAGAEALVWAAELLHEIETTGQDAQLPVDGPLVYFMAGQACKHFEKYEAALSFFERARHDAPEREEIAREIADLQDILGASRRVA